MTFIKYFIFEIHLRFRNPSQLFFSFAFPIFLMFAFASSFGKTIPHYIENNIANIMMYSVLSASLTSLSVQISEYQSGKIYALFSQRGIRRSVYITAQILSFMCIIFLSTISIMLIAHFAYSYTIPSVQKLLIFYGKLYLYSIPFYFLAFIIGITSKNTTTASAVAMPVMFVSFFFSGMMIPLSQLTGGIQNIAHHFFLTSLISDLTHTLTSHYTVIPNWFIVQISILSLIIAAAIVSYRNK